MSFYRSLLAASAALFIVLPAFAEEASIPTEQNTQATVSSEATAPKVDINKATVKELTKVKGITPIKAKSIVNYRKKKGDFKSLDDLKKVKGFQKMNDQQMKMLQDHLTIS